MEPKQISVLIPVYKESKLLEKLLTELVSQTVEKEIFVIIDEPTEESLKISKKFEKEVKFILNKKRFGKASALNKAAKLSSGKILLFLDDDIELQKDQKFLEKIIEEMEDIDFLDIKKEVVRDSFLSKMAYFEYAGISIGSWLISGVIKKCPSINGSAFAMRRNVFNSLKGFRKVMCEDIDIAMRGFLKNYRFKYTKKVEVHNHVHSNWRNLMVQRKRWSIGTALWFKEWHRELLKNTVKQPQIYMPTLFFLFPSLILLILNFLVPVPLMYKLSYLFLLVIAVKFNFVAPILLFTTLGIDVFRYLFISLVSFLSFSVLFFILSRKLGFKFKIHEFFVYYFFYSLLVLLIMIVGLIKVFVFKRKLVSDWKI